MQIVAPRRIASNFQGYTSLIGIYKELRQANSGEKVILDFANTSWIDANLLAVMGAMFDKVASSNQVELININSNFESLWQRNSFLMNFGGGKIYDRQRTTISYNCFDKKATRAFERYLETELLANVNLPTMSVVLKREIKKSILEIFVNAEMHGRALSVFTCGQHYPSTKRLDFTVVDVGRTIRRNVRNFLNKDVSSTDAIKWAVTEGNTTKKCPIPGGLGLSLIRQFLKKNNGSIQIVSSYGFWEENSDKETIISFDDIFPGTIVNLEFNLADTSRYYLASEPEEEIVF